MPGARADGLDVAKRWGAGGRPLLKGNQGQEQREQPQIFEFLIS